MFCYRCGQENVEAARFCTACGANLVDHTATSGSVGTTGGAPAIDARLAETLNGTRTGEAQAVRSGQTLGGRYRITERLGSGGMGEVWRAEDAELGIDVAIKVLPALLARTPRSIARLKQEAAVALRLTHPNICRLYNLHSDGAVKFLVMEYVDGRTVEDVLAEREDGRMKWGELEPIARQIGRALDYAHDLDPPVLHRDIKPANVMIDAKGHGRLLDFGIARELRDSLTRLTGQQDSSGTIPYMSPEQFRGERMDRRSDIYSFCLVLYEALAGAPFVHPSGSYAWQVQEKLFQPLEGVPPLVNRALAAGLAKDCSVRPRSVDELLGGASPTPTEAAAEARQMAPTIRSAEGLAQRITLDCGSGVTLEATLIPAGTFRMGSPRTEASRHRNEGPQREVTISTPFYMGLYPVTQEQYAAVAKADPSYFKGARNPVEWVSWDEAVEFCREFSRKSGRTVRLPTEAQWEYACRAGTMTPFHTGTTISTDEANYDGTHVYGNGREGEYRQKTVPVGSFAPNAFGLHDMHGNVWEWCGDWSSDSYANAGTVDPRGPDSGSSRVLRGGSWSVSPAFCRSAARSWIRPGRRRRDIGFRVVVVAGGAE